MDSGDRAQLFNELSHLPQADFERLLTVVAMPRMNRAGSSAKVGEQVSALLDWADSYVGPGLSAIQDYLDKLKNGNLPPAFDFSGYLEFILRQDSRYQDVRDLYTETEVLIPLEAETVERRASEENSRSTEVLIPLEAETVERRASEENSRSLEITQQKVERFPVLEGLQKHALGEKRQHLLLAGRPGSGKSTTLKRLLLETAEAALEQPEIIPVYVQLKGDRPVIELILAEFRRAKVRISAEQLEDWLLEDRLLLLLDGVNEIPSDQQRRKLQAFREDNPITPMIFTTRDLAVGGDLGIQKRLEMRPLSEPQMWEFVNKYLTQRGLPNQADTLLRQLKDRLREVAETPLLLKMLCDVFDSTTGQIPQSKGELFRLFDAKYDQFKGLVAVSDDFRRFKPELLQHLAFCMLQGDPTSPTEAWLTIDRSQAERLLETYLTGRVEAPGQRAKEWLEDLLEHHLLQVATDPREIEFHHQLFQEYYAAEALLLKLELSDLLEDEAQFKRDYLNLLKWTEPIALMLALVDEEAQALRVVKLAMDDMDLMLGARLAGEVQPSLREQTVQWIADLEIHQSLKIELLGKTASEETIPYLEIYVKDKNNEYVAQSAAFKIVKLYTDKAVSSLLRNLEELLRNSDLTVNVNSIIIALGKTGSQKATAKLLELVNHPNLSISTQAIIAISKINPNQAKPILIEKLGNPDFDSYTYTDLAFEAGRLGLGEAIPALISAYVDKRADYCKEEIGFALNMIIEKSSDAISYLTQIIQEPNSFPVWEMAICQLGKIRSEESIPVLIKAFDNSLPSIRLRVIQALGNIGSESAIPFIRQVENDKDLAPAVLYSYAQIAPNTVGRDLRKIFSEKAKNTSILNLSKEIKKPQPDSTMALFALLMTNSEEADSALDEILENPDSSFRKIAINKLGQRAKICDIEILAAAIKDIDYEVREAAVTILADLISKNKIPHPINQEVFSSLLDFSIKTNDVNDEILRPFIFTCLIKLDSQKSLELLTLLLDNSDDRIRSDVVKALANFSAEHVAPVLIKVLDDPSCEVRISAIETLGKLGSQQAIPAMLKILDYTRPDKKNDLEEILQTLDPDQLFLTTIKLAKTPSDNIYNSLFHDRKIPNYSHYFLRRKIADALGNIPSLESINALAVMLSDPDYVLQQKAAKSLGQKKDKKVIKYLLKRLNYSICNAYEIYLKEIMETYEDCTSLIVDLSPLSVGLINVREAICQALADLECPEALSGLWNMELWHPYGLSAILSIQSHCKFYNYEIWQEAMFAQNAAKESLKVKTAPASNVFPNATEVKIFERVEHYYENPSGSD